MQVVTYPVPRGETPPEREWCYVRLFVPGTLEKVVRAVVMDQWPDVVLGRDILNDLRLTLEARGDLVALEPSAKPSGP